MSPKPSPASSSYEPKPPHRRTCRSKILGIPIWVLSIVLLVAVVVVIVVPIAVMFGKKKDGSPRSEVLVPLYVYPAPGAWDPLFQA